MTLEELLRNAQLSPERVKWHKEQRRRARLAQEQRNMSNVIAAAAKIEMVVTPWARDEFGNQWREVYAA